MSRATAEIKRFAELLIEFESSRKQSQETDLPIAFRICDHLRPHLSMLMGKMGFWALLTRALTLAAMEVPDLRAVRVKRDGVLEVIESEGNPSKPMANEECGVVLIAHLLCLLVAFVGEDLTLRLIREMWPNLPVNYLSFSKGDEK